MLYDELFSSSLTLLPTTTMNDTITIDLAAHAVEMNDGVTLLSHKVLQLFDDKMHDLGIESWTCAHFELFQRWCADNNVTYHSTPDEYWCDERQCWREWSAQDGWDKAVKDNTKYLILDSLS